MKQILKRSVLALFSLCALYSYAERETVSQSFRSLGSALTYANSNKTGITSFVTYTCTGTNAEFAWIGEYINIKLPDKDNFVTTTKVNELRGLQIFCDPSNTTPSNIEIYLSKDSLDFGSALSAGVTYSKTGIDAVGAFPRGNYYVRIKNNKGSNTISIRSVVFYLDHCNCFEYIPE